ncbi:hypothetical protein NL676_005360 [Syzygium grande]|nr:hypothetical protein NL676_005360 [Syzygium grande]
MVTFLLVSRRCMAEIVATIAPPMITLTATTLKSLFENFIVELFDNMKKPKALPSLSIYPRDGKDRGL